MVVAPLFLYGALYLQMISGGGHRKVMAAAGCTITGTFKDCFPYTENPISNSSKWTAASGTCGFVGAVKAAGAGAIQANANAGCAVLTGFTVSAPIANRVQLDTAAGSGISGTCLWQDTLGNGICYLINLGQLYKVTAGAGTPLGIMDCPGISGRDHDVWEISVSGTTYTCTDVTLGTSGTPVTDATFTPTHGGFIVDSGRTVVAYGWQ